MIQPQWNPGQTYHWKPKTPFFLFSSLLFFLATPRLDTTQAVGKKAAYHVFKGPELTHLDWRFDLDFFLEGSWQSLYVPIEKQSKAPNGELYMGQ